MIKFAKSTFKVFLQTFLEKLVLKPISHKSKYVINYFDLNKKKSRITKFTFAVSFDKFFHENNQRAKNVS